MFGPGGGPVGEYFAPAERAVTVFEPDKNRWAVVHDAKGRGHRRRDWYAVGGDGDTGQGDGHERRTAGCARKGKRADAGFALASVIGKRGDVTKEVDILSPVQSGVTRSGPVSRCQTGPYETRLSWSERKTRPWREECHWMSRSKARQMSDPMTEVICRTG